MNTRATADELISVVARLNRLATQRAGLELPYAQVRLLALVAEKGGSRISDLASFDSCSQPTMTTHVQRLEAAGLVSRSADPDDARAVLVSVTAAGRRTLAAARAARTRAMAPYFDALPPADLDVLTDAVPILRRLLADASTVRT